jgi:branched-chain amino acid transport system ATP-binding protein
MMSSVASDTRESVLDISNVSLAFGRLKAINELSLSVGRGITTGLIGPNGAGKTTVLNCISGFYRPDSGTITHGGTAISGFPTHRIAKMGIGRTFQHTELLAKEDAVTNVMAGMHIQLKYRFLSAALRLPGTQRAESDGRKKAAEYLSFVGLKDVGDRPVGELSYGHQKLIELARALSVGTELLLLDEPTAGMNKEEKENVAFVINQIKAELGISQLLIEHDTRFVELTCDRVFALDLGSVLASGTAREVLTDPKVVKAFIGAPTEKEIASESLEAQS